MTLAERLWQEGFEEGFGEGYEQVVIAKNALMEGADPEFVAEITGVDLDSMLAEAAKQVLTLSEQLKLRGIGREVARVKIAKSAFVEGAEPEFIAKITGLSLKTVLELQASLDKSSE